MTVTTGLAGPEVVTAEQQVHRVRPSGRRRHDGGDNGSGRAAAGSVCHGMPQARQQVVDLVEIPGVLVAVRKPALHETRIMPRQYRR